MLRAVYRQQHSDSLRNSIRRRAFQPTKKQVFLQLPNSFRLTFFTGHHTFRPTAYFLPAPAGQYLTSPLIFSSRAKSQPPGLQQPSFSPIDFHPPTSSLFSRNLPLKKTEPSAQLFPLYISSTFPGLYNPQFSSCNTKPKCLRMPAKSGSLLLSSVITGLSFSSHSRLNSISLLPRPL